MLFATVLNMKMDALQSFCNIFSFPQIGDLENFYLFEHQRLHKRSTAPSDHHHEALAQDPQVSEEPLEVGGSFRRGGGRVSFSALLHWVNLNHFFVRFMQGLLDDLDSTLVSEVYISRPSSIYSLYSINRFKSHKID